MIGASPGRRPSTGILALVLVVLAVAARLARLEADPCFHAWWGYVPDEGRWVEQVRNLALHGTLGDIRGVRGIHLLMAPIFQLASLVSFLVLGVSRVSARLFPLACGIAFLALLWRHLRRHASPTGQLAGLALVAFQGYYFLFSRVAIPEAPAILAELTVYAALAAGATPAWLLGAGLAAVVALGLKATSGFAVAGFAIAVPLLPGRVGAGGRRRDLALFAAPLVTAALAALAAAARVLPEGTGDVAGSAAFLRRFLGLSPPARILWLALERLADPTLFVPLVGLWVAGLAAVAPAAPAAPEDAPALARATRLAWIWTALFGLVSVTLHYFPDRYFIHVITPIAILTALGVSRLEERGTAGLARALTAARSWRAVALAALLVLPTAIFLAPLPAALAVVAGGAPDRVAVRLAALAAALATAAAAALRLRRRRWLVDGLIAFPVAAAVLGFSRWQLAGERVDLWPGPDPGGHLGTHAVFLLAALVLAALPLLAARRRPAATGGAIRAAALAFSGVSAAGVAPGLLAPHYTLPEISRDLGRLLGGSGSVSESLAEGLFLDNDVAFAALGPSWKERPPEHLVIAFRFKGDRELLARRYRPIKSYEVYFSPRHRLWMPDWDVLCCNPEGHSVTVYRRRDDDDAAAGPAPAR